MNYKGYTIEEDYRYLSKPQFMYYLTEEGVQHDADYDGDSFKYCGNCKWADTLEEAKAEIDDKETMKRYIFSKSLAKIEQPKVIETSEAYSDDLHPVGYSLFSISKMVLVGSFI